MEKDIDKIKKNNDTDIVIRIDDFGGKRGLTIREYVKSERYTGFTKAGTRVPAEQFKIFKAAINSIDEKDLESSGEVMQEKLTSNTGEKSEKADQGKPEKKEKQKKMKVDIEEAEM